MEAIAFVRGTFQLAHIYIYIYIYIHESVASTTSCSSEGESEDEEVSLSSVIVILIIALKKFILFSITFNLTFQKMQSMIKETQQIILSAIHSSICIC